MAWLPILAYLFVQLILCLWVARFVKSEKDFFIAGRNLPLWMVSVSLFASWYGAETCIGSAGAVYAKGLSGSRADPFGYATCLALMGLFLAARMWRGGYMTLGDFYKERFGPRIEALAVWILLPSSIIWAAAQVRAFGQIISATTELEVNTAILLSTAFVIGYTFIGGLLGDIVTDIVQGGILCVGLIVLLVFAFHEVPDVPALFQNMESTRLSFFAEEGSFWAQLDRMMVPILGSLVAQELLSRVFSAKSEGVARQASFVACAIYLVLGSIPVILGLIGPAILSHVDHHEEYLVVLGKTILPPLMYTIFVGALISAILSTINTILLGISALLSHNFLVPLLKLKTERSKVLSARLVVIASGMIGYVLAVSAESIYDLLEEASSFGTAGILVTTLGGLSRRFGTSLSAGGALVSGLIVTPLCRFVFEVDAPFLASIGVALFVYCAFAVRTGRVPAPIADSLAP